MFDEGQVVYHKKRPLGALTVVDVDGPTIYVNLKNGVEMDFQAGDLVTEEPKTTYELAQEREKAESKARSNKILDGGKVIEVTQEHLDMLTKMPDVCRGAFKKLYERIPFSGRWEELNPSQQINFIMSMTGTSLEGLMRQASSPLMMMAMLGRGIDRTLFGGQILGGR